MRVVLQYYYNPQTQQFLYWDGAQQTYLPAPTQGQGQDAQSTSGGATGQQQAAGGENKEVKEKDKKQKGQMAKKIAKVNLNFKCGCVLSAFI